MLVHEGLAVLDLSNFHTFRVDGEIQSLRYIKGMLGDCILKRFVVTASNKTLTKDNIRQNILINDETTFDGIIEVEYELPATSQFINLELNIIIKGE